MIKKIKEWWKRQNSTTQAFIFLIVILIIVRGCTEILNAYKTVVNTHNVISQRG